MRHLHSVRKARQRSVINADALLESSDATRVCSPPLTVGGGGGAGEQQRCQRGCRDDTEARASHCLSALPCPGGSEGGSPAAWCWALCKLPVPL